MDRINIVKQLDKQKIYTRKELFQTLGKYSEGYSYNSFNWDIQKMLLTGLVHKVGRNTYKIGSANKKIYKPRYSMKSKEIIEFMEKEYNDTVYSLFETSMLNEFLNHQIAQNTYFISVERELSEFVFRDIQRTLKDTILYKPRKDDLRKYWNPKSIIIIDRVSEAPSGINNYDTPLEKMFVDLISDKSLMYMFSGSEYDEMLQIANEKYYIDYSKLFRYARRRGKLVEIKNIMKNGGINIDNI